MKDFKYCIWLCLDEKHQLNDYCYTGRNGIYICIDSEIKTLKEARYKFDSLIKKPVKIYIDNKPRQGRIGDLHALCYKAKSLAYCSYIQSEDIIFGLSHSGQRQTYKEDIYYISKAIGILQEPAIILNHFKLVKATGDYRYHWLVIDDYIASSNCSVEKRQMFVTRQ